MHKYTAIINSSSYDDIIERVEELEMQKYSPSQYIIIYNNPTLDNRLYLYFHNFEKQWNIKIPLEDEIPESIIDECFRLKKVKHKFCLYIQQSLIKNILPDFSTKLAEIINPDYWYYHYQNMIFFPTVLCRYFAFKDMEKGIESYNYKDKIYNEYIAV